MGSPINTSEGAARRQALARRDLEQLADRALDIIYRFRLRPSRGFEYVNAAAERILGYTPEEHYADPDLGQKLVHPDDRPVVEALLEAGPTAPLVLRWRRKDGKLIWLEGRNTPVYENGELVAIEGIARKIDDPTRSPGATIRVLNGVRLDLMTQAVYVDGNIVHLTPTEFKLLALLTDSPGEPLSREKIMRYLWQSEHVGNQHTCETHVSSLRQKIERIPRFPERILTVRGHGYMFAADGHRDEGIESRSST